MILDRSVPKLSQGWSEPFAVVLDDLRFPPDHRLEALKGNRAVQHSPRLNDQWRICFVWTERRPAEVEIVDYHRREGAT